MIKLIPLFILLCSSFAIAKEYKVGPVILEIPDEYDIENNNEDILLGQIRSGNNVSLNFNVQIADIANGDVSTPDGLESLKKGMSEIIEHSKSTSKSGHQHEYLSGQVSAKNFNGSVQVIEITGNKYKVYFAFSDTSEKRVHEFLFMELKDQIDSSEL